MRCHFYPRSPCGERRDVIAVMTDAQSISIHALLAESDYRAKTISTKISHFYPRSPCGERRPLIFNVQPRKTISIHALLAESDPSSTVIVILRKNFYPRSPCGERQPATSGNNKNNVFLSTLSLRRATLLLTSCVLVSGGFLSTLSLRRATIDRV